MTGKKTGWSSRAGFDPTEAGFVFRPELSIYNLIVEMLTEFRRTAPPGHPLEKLVAGILVDGIAFWHLAEELERNPEYAVEREEFQQHFRFFGLPVMLFGIEGMCLAFKPILAPAVLRQQLEEARGGGKESLDERLDKKVQELEKAEPEESPLEELAPAKKEDMH